MIVTAPAPSAAPGPRQLAASLVYIAAVWAAAATAAVPILPNTELNMVELPPGECSSCQWNHFQTSLKSLRLRKLLD